jgi:hypothetical protein|tara:strand:- start:210 stop:437 length:228 start_codon:yes stop_codon:yes gene_type:complete
MKKSKKPALTEQVRIRITPKQAEQMESILSRITNDPNYGTFITSRSSLVRYALNLGLQALEGNLQSVQEELFREE